MKQEPFDPKMEWQKIKFETLAQVARYLARHGLAVVILVAVVAYLIVDRQDSRMEFKSQISEVKQEFSQALNLSRAEVIATQVALDSCDAQRLTLAVRVARLETIVQQIRKR